MNDYSDTARMKVSKARGEGVTVKVWDQDGDVENVTFEGTATTWVEVDGLAIAQGVPRKLIFVDADAAEYLGPR